MAERISAWLLAPLGMPPVMVAEHEVVQYLDAAQPLLVPMTPVHCSAAIFWLDRIVPLMSLGGCVEQGQAIVPKLAILAYQRQPGMPLNYLALALRAAPTKITVTDAAVCDLPEEDAELWQVLAKSCVCHENEPVPIISVAKLCSAGFLRYAEKSLDIPALTAVLPWLQAGFVEIVAREANQVIGGGDAKQSISVQHPAKPAGSESQASSTAWNIAEKIVAPAVPSCIDDFLDEDDLDTDSDDAEALADLKDEDWLEDDDEPDSDELEDEDKLDEDGETALDEYEDDDDLAELEDEDELDEDDEIVENELENDDDYIVPERKSAFSIEIPTG